MNKIVVSALVAAATIVSVPAAAQHYRGGGGGSISQQLSQLRDRIHRAEDRDVISKREEDRLLREAKQIDRLHDRYRRNGLNYRERQDLQNRIQNLRQRLRWERNEDRRGGYRR